MKVESMTNELFRPVVTATIFTTSTIKVNAVNLNDQLVNWFQLHKTLQRDIELILDRGNRLDSMTQRCDTLQNSVSIKQETYIAGVRG